MKQVITFIATILAISTINAQTQITPRYSTDSRINASVMKGDTLIVAGDFSNVGLYTGGGCVVTTNSDKPNLSFPKINGNITASSSDGNGGFYIAGNFTKESELDTTYTKLRIEHVLANNAYDPNFSIDVSGSLIRQLLFYNDNLYVGGVLLDSINHQKVYDFAGINTNTKQIINWIPKVKADGTYGVDVLKINPTNSTLYIAGNFDSVGGLYRNKLAAIEINTGNIKPWNYGSNLPSTEYFSKCYDLAFYKNKIIVSGPLGLTGIPTYHACVLVDTIIGSNSQYLFNSVGLFGGSLNAVYWGADGRKIAVSGDTLFASFNGTFDTRITAFNLLNNTYLWSKFFNMIAEPVSMQVKDGALYVVGNNLSEIYTTNQDNQSISNLEKRTKNVVKLNTANGSLLNWFPDPVGIVYNDVWTMSFSGENIFLGGRFSHLNGLERNGIFMLNTGTDEVLPFNLNLDYYSKDIKAIKLIDSTVYIAGDFQKINGQSISSTALAFNVNTGQLLNWFPTYLGYGVSCIDANSKYLFIGGSYLVAEPSGGLDRKSLFAIDRQTAAISGWNPQFKGSTFINAMHITDNKLYLSGTFDSIVGQARNGFAVFDTSFNLQNLNIPNSINAYSINQITSKDSLIWLGTSFGNGLYGISKTSGSVIHNLPISFPYSVSTASMVFKGRYLIAVGNISKYGSNCKHILLYDYISKSIVPSSVFCNTFNGSNHYLNAVSFAGDDMYLGGQFQFMNYKSNATNFERIRFPAGFFNNPILPLTLLNFSATQQEKSILLNWTTANQINTSHFNIQRSTNGREFGTIGNVNSIGNGSYQFNDKEFPNTKIIYYRLQIVDKDGSIQYSNIQTINIKASSNNFIIYPNPSKGNFSIYITPTIQGRNTIKVFDIVGKLVTHQTLENTSIATFSNNFNNGIYSVQITNNTTGKTETQKLIINKN